MATILFGGYQGSFLYSGEDFRFCILYWCTGRGVMDRFFPSSKQHASWSRNYKWPSRDNNRTSQQNTQNPSLSVSQAGYEPIDAGHIIKVRSTNSLVSKDKDRRKGGSRETLYGQGVTLRARDLLIGGSSEIFTASSQPVYSRSNPPSPHGQFSINPSCTYLLPSLEDYGYDRRRTTLGGSALELHTGLSPQTQLVRRSSDGNYESYESSDVPKPTFLRNTESTGNRRSLRVPQDSLDTSESSISSVHATGTSAPSADLDTYSSSTSVSGHEGDPTTTSSPPTSTASEDSSSKESGTSVDTECSYCRLVSSDGGSTTEESCCICAGTACTCTVYSQRTKPVLPSIGRSKDTCGDQLPVSQDTVQVRNERPSELGVNVFETLKESSLDTSLDKTTGGSNLAKSRANRRKNQRFFKLECPKEAAEDVKKFSEHTDKIDLRVYSPNAFTYHRIVSSRSRSKQRGSRTTSVPSENFEILQGDRTFKSRTKSHSLDQPEEPMETSSVPRRTDYRRSKSYGELGQTSNISQTKESPVKTPTAVRPHMPLQKTRHKHYTDLPAPSPPSNNSPSTIRGPGLHRSRESPRKRIRRITRIEERVTRTTLKPSCKIALTKETSSEARITEPTDVQLEETKSFDRKKPSKILHTRVTLVKRETVPSKETKLDDNLAISSKGTNTDVYELTIHKISSESQRVTTMSAETVPAYRKSQKHSCIHSPTKTVPEVTIEAPRSHQKVETRIQMFGTIPSTEVRLEIPEDPCSITEPSTIIEDLDTTPGVTSEISPSAPARCSDAGGLLAVGNSMTDVSESLISTSIDANAVKDSPSSTTDVTNKESFSFDLGDANKSEAKSEGMTAATEDDECSTCVCGDSLDTSSVAVDLRTGDEMVLSEEECSVCQRERALSPDVVVMTSSKEGRPEASEFEGSDSCKTEDMSTTAALDLSSTTDVPEGEQSNVSTLTSSTSASKTKTPDYLSADFPFEPEIVHKANPLVDEADDDACMRNLGSPFRRMSESEFVASLNIHEAAGKGDLHVVKLLVKKDHKQMETVDERGWTPIHLAAAHGHADIVKYLAQEGAHLAALDPSSYTANHLAAMNGHYECVEFLLKLGVDVDCVTSEGFTPLHLAVMNAHTECSQILLHWGASLEKRDALGRNVQDMIEEYNLDEMLHLICKFRHQLKKFQEMLKMLNPSEKAGFSLTASLSQLNQSEVPQDVLEMLNSLAEDSEDASKQK